MKTMRMITLCLICCLMASCSWFEDTTTPEGYVKHCIRLMDKNGLYAEGEAWQTMKQRTLEKASQITTLEEAHALISEALRIAGGKHSVLNPPVEERKNVSEEKVPEVNLREKGLIVVKLPAHSGITVSDSLYTFTVFDFIAAHKDAKGVIIDLQDNVGGNMYPMLAAVSPLIPEGIFIRFKGRKSNTPITIEYVEKQAGISGSKSFKLPASLPIAILTNEWTGSSGEATLLAFRGLENVRTFGTPTAGYASSNIPYQLSDGYTLVLTVGQDVARTGEVFCDDPIAPDVETETALEDAVNWINERNV